MSVCVGVASIGVCKHLCACVLMWCKQPRECVDVCHHVYVCLCICALVHVHERCACEWASTHVYVSVMYPCGACVCVWHTHAQGMFCLDKHLCASMYVWVLVIVCECVYVWCMELSSIACVGAWCVCVCVWCAKAHRQEVYPSCAPMQWWECARTCEADELVCNTCDIALFASMSFPCSFSILLCAQLFYAST